MANYWLKIDFPGIKKFLFSSDRAKEIRGASAILAHLNEEIYRHEKHNVIYNLEKNFPNNVEIVSAGGGGGLFRLRNTSKEKIESFLTKFKSKAEEKSGGGISLEYSIVEENGSPQSEKEYIDLSHQKLQEKRYSGKLPAPRTMSGIFRLCESCHVNPAEVVDEDLDGEEEFICGVCKAKRDFDRDLGKAYRDIWYDYIKIYSSEVGKWKAQSIRPESFNDIGVDSREYDNYLPKFERPGYIALIYADGDDMGKLLQDFKTAREYRIFSRALDSALRLAVYESLRKIFPFDLVNKLLAQSGKEERVRLPVDLFLLGGDDIVAVIRADLALKFVVLVAENFQDFLPKSLDKALIEEGLTENSISVRKNIEKLTISFGVAVFKYKFPFHQAIKQAQNLLSSAKKARAEHLQQLKRQSKFTDPQPFIDWADISQSRFLELNMIRADVNCEKWKEDEKFTGWPRSLKETMEFLDWVEKFKNARISKNKILQLIEAISQSQAKAVFEAVRIIGHQKEKQHVDLLTKFIEKYSDKSEQTSFKKLLPLDSSSRAALFDLAKLYPYFPESKDN